MMLLSVLILLLLVVGRCSRLELVGRSLKTRTENRTETETRTRTENRTETRTRSMNRTETRTKTEPETSRGGVKSLERERRSDQEAHPRDPRHKEKFIRHLTGPLNFNPKCRKHFYRLYHSTRDCTIPAYYKRCARLLTRLANSPRCAER